MNAYGLSWPYDDPIDVELECIRLGGKFQIQNKWFGEGLAHHYQKLQSELWPWKKWDPWSLLILQELIQNKLTLLVGPANAAKTHSVAAFMLSRYIAYPVNNCNLVSSTDSRSLELRIWGEIKKLWNEARMRYPSTPGRIVESRQMIVTDKEEDRATDFRNGIIAIPCLVGGSYQGLGKFVGIKSGSVFLAADELSFMSEAFYDGISNMSKNAGFKCAGMGNPKDRTDVLGKLAEPAPEIGGWEGYSPTGKLMIWKTRFPGGKCVQLDGRDTPNNKAAIGAGWPFPYLINREDIQRDVAYYGEDSVQVSMMDYGIFPRDAQARRVITRTMCERFRAFEEPIWGHEPLTHLFALDAAYGAVGGDRCIGIELAFGKCTDGVVRLAFSSQPIVIPVKASVVDQDGKPIMPEDQIARWVMDYCENPSRSQPIPLSNVGFDSTGRGSLVAAFGRLWGNDFHAVEFGALPTERMVSAKIRTPCSIYYFNFVTELWFNVATVIVSDQMRGLPMAVMEEGAMRGWEMVKDKKVQIEPKAKCKERMGRSPDTFDALAVGVEVAQRIGFELGQAGENKTEQTPRWLLELLERQKQARLGYRLKAR